MLLKAIEKILISMQLYILILTGLLEEIKSPASDPVIYLESQQAYFCDIKLHVIS